jgi:hypothetical protein
MKKPEAVGLLERIYTVVFPGHHQPLEKPTKYQEAGIFGS